VRSSVGPIYVDLPPLLHRSTKGFEHRTPMPARCAWDSILFGMEVLEEDGGLRPTWAELAGRYNALHTRPSRP